MLIRNLDNLIEITPLERVPAHLPTPGDTRFAVRIQSENFAGEGTAWVDWPTLQQFSRDLTALELNRKGQAELRSMSPGDFLLIIKTVDGWGHTAVAGRLAVRKHAVEFDFEFDCDHLAAIASEFTELAQPVS